MIILPTIPNICQQIEIVGCHSIIFLNPISQWMIQSVVKMTVNNRFLTKRKLKRQKLNNYNWASEFITKGRQISLKFSTIFIFISKWVILCISHWYTLILSLCRCLSRLFIQFQLNPGYNRALLWHFAWDTLMFISFGIWFVQYLFLLYVPYLCFSCMTINMNFRMKRNIKFFMT